MSSVLYVPVKGYLVNLEKVSDPVFSEKMLGDGFAIESLENRLLSPVDGVGEIYCLGLRLPLKMVMMYLYIWD